MPEGWRRVYVQSLLARLELLRSTKKNSDLGSEEDLTSAPTNIDPIHRDIDISPTALKSTTLIPDPEYFESPAQNLDPKNDVKSMTYDIVISSTATKQRFYWGASSIFSLTVEILQHAISNNIYTLEAPMAAMDFLHFDDESEDVQYSSTQIDSCDDDVRALIDLYLVSLDTLYGFINKDEAKVDLETYIALRQQTSFSPNHLQGEQAHRWFRINMMCAISCANQARHRPARSAESLIYFHGALSCVEKVTSEASPASLQALLLLIVFCLFYPKKGDIWKLLAHACRLAIELGYHAQDPYEHAPVGTDDAEMRLRRSTFWGLYAVERIVGQLFGRGSDLPETIITTAYPSSNSTDSTFDIGPTSDPEEVQSISISRHYRLIYLRSEIFRCLYLPARPLNLDLDWLKERYTTLHNWRQEQVVSDEMAGVATLTCDVGFDATICFLFQPLILQILRAASLPTAASTNPLETHIQDNDILVPSDPFYCSVSLIATYEKIIRAPERSAFGCYPMTFMSAHYIYLASSMLIAYALLQLKPNVKFIRRFRDLQGETKMETEDIEWDLFLDTVGSCLILLGWCAERWPGFIETLGVHNKLFSRLTKELIKLGVL
ncbi:unnamed protein product [Clonostachys rosea]|uniref:Xylanolytic transcriptional activator regulatory domain-containing protein n=1 Tax=Bionectria ochroleuca TaxID=29856 RepID=A0ABY6TQV4_BIOOC|nr:unnamed protein product [Clonostachys rosea]